MYTNTPENLERSITGCLLGTAAGDSLGLPFEGLSRSRCEKFFSGSPGHCLLPGRGMVSDDTEHSLMVAESLLRFPYDVDQFLDDFSRRLRWWLLGLPAGIGMATLKACLKLWLGFSAKRSGVFSAGNGPAMRSGIIGVLHRNDPDKMREMVKASTRVTHSDPRALWGALAIALAAAESSRSTEVNIPRYFGELMKLLGPGSEEFLELVNQALESVQSGESSEFFATERLGLTRGVSGFMLHTIPVVLHVWLSNPADFRQGITEVLKLGGDTDTCGAIVGGIIGAGVGKSGIPMEYVDEIWEWPRSMEWVEELSRLLARKFTDEPHGVFSGPSFNPFLVPVRNCIFSGVVLSHGFRRLFPPY